ncbi:HAD family hydrolase [Phenylobacterium terrae]|uniref:HAD family hydrolase n=1 Tax=Phenylobacterium terrae TaxID=2665495 RepID=A0ABW4N363_9CAUL
MTALPRAILFDLDDTIISAGPRGLLLRTLAEEIAHLLPMPPDEAARRLEAANRDFWSDETRHRTWRFRLEEARTAIVERVFESWRPQAPGLTPDVARQFGARFHRLREENACFPGAVETIDELKARGVLLALVTNGAAEAQRAKVARFDLARRFDHVQIEGEAGFGKPEERAYRHALEALGVQPHEAWMVGDNLEWEVAAPQRLGIFGIWHDHLGEGLPPGSTVRPDRIIRALPELLD